MAPPPQARVTPLWAGALAAAVVLAVFWPAVGAPWTPLDDPDYVTSNPHVLAGLSWAGLRWAFTTFRMGHWHPLTWLSLMFDVSLAGPSPGWLHFVNVSLHAATAGVLTATLAGATGETGLSAAAILLFALHPLRVESVAWAAERKDVLSVFFASLCLAAYFRWAKRRSRAAFAAAHVLFAAALVSKSTVMTLPFGMLLLDAWPLARWKGERARSLAAEKAGFFALSAASSGAAFAAARTFLPLGDHKPLAVRLEHVPIAYLQYLEKTLCPTRLAIFYPYGTPSLGASLAAAAALVGLTALAWRARRPAPACLVGWLWFLGTLVPMIGLTQAGGQSIADRFSYLPHIGLAVAAAWGLAALARGASAPKPGALAAAVVALSALAWTAREQARLWTDPDRLLELSLEQAPDHYQLNNLLGESLARRGDLAAAEARLRKAVASAPGFAEAQANLGLVLAQEGRVPDAVAPLELAVRERPDAANFHLDLALVDVRLGRLAEAEAEYRRAIELRPDDSAARSDLGSLLFRMGRKDAAIEQFRAAVRLSPYSPEAHNNLGIALAMSGDRQAALAEFSRALELKPDFELAKRNLRLAASPDGGEGTQEALSIR